MAEDARPAVPIAVARWAAGSSSGTGCSEVLPLAVEYSENREQSAA